MTSIENLRSPIKRPRNQDRISEHVSRRRRGMGSMWWRWGGLCTSTWYLVLFYGVEYLERLALRGMELVL
jgi:hypothetical protein